MKKASLLFTVILMYSGLVAQPQGGRLLEDQSLNSKILGYGVEYAVYLPPDYDYSSRSYPIVYLLHGYTDDETGWVQFGEVKRIVDQHIASGEIPPMVIVMPNGGVTWYMNDHAGKERWEDMFIREFLPHVEGKYRVRSKKEYRAISGLSMGGFGSLRISLNNPDLFVACAAYSSALWTVEDFRTMPQENYNRMFGKLYGEGLESESRITEHFKAHSVIEMVKSKPVEELKKVRIYFDCGDDDFLAIGNATLHIELKKRQIPHEYRVRDGIHSWPFWRASLPIGLGFIGESFHR